LDYSRPDLLILLSSPSSFSPLPLLFLSSSPRLFLFSSSPPLAASSSPPPLLRLPQVRIDEYGGNPSRPKWAQSIAMVTYYSPHLGAIHMEVGQQGYIAGRVWYVMMVDGTTRQPLPCTRDLCPEREQPRN
jgi:hypothetical protein